MNGIGARMIHPMVNKQVNIFGLIIAFCDYGVDYYWKERDGFLFTSGKRHIYWQTDYKDYIFDIRCGLKVGNKQYLFPNTWRRLFGLGNPNVPRTL